MQALTFDQLPNYVLDLGTKIEGLEQLLKTALLPAPTPEKPLNIDEAAKMLELSKTTIYGLVHHQLIPNYKTGKRLYFDRAELMEWVRSGRRKTIKETQAEAAAHKKGGVSK
jgi:excisionase family DNA binding protein